MTKILKGMPINKKAKFDPSFGLAVTTTIPGNDPDNWAAAITMLKSCRRLHIAQFRIDWPLLENNTTPGVYDGPGWAKMDQVISDVDFPENLGGPRDVSILINVKRFDQTYNLVPTYMLDDPVTGTYNGGQNNYPSQPGFVAGRLLCFDNANVQARFAALAAEFGRRYANNRRIHFVGFPETSYGAVPDRIVDEFVHFDGVLACLKSLKSALPYTQIRCVFNYPRDVMATFIPKLVAARIHAFGGSNAIQDENGLGINLPYPGEYQHIQTYHNNMVSLMELQKPEMENSNHPNRIDPAPTWGTITLANNGGLVQLVGSGAHGLAVGEHVNTFDAVPPAGISLTAAINNWPSGYLDIVSVDTANAMTVVNRAAWTGPTLAAGALTYAIATSRSLGDPSTKVSLAASPAYPYGSGFTYVPNSNTYNGYVPSKKQLIDFAVTDLFINYAMITYNTDINSRSGRTNNDDWVDYLNSMPGNNTLGGGLVATRPVQLLPNHKKIAPLAGIGHEINGVLASPEALLEFRQSFVDGGALLASEAGTALPDTGYPVIDSVTEFTFSTDAVNHAITLPAVSAGNCILAVVTNDGSATVATPVGWVQMYSDANGTSVRGSCFAKVAATSDSGATVDFVTSSAENMAVQLFVVSSWNGSLAGIQIGTVTQGSSGTTADLPAINAYWGSSKFFVIGALHTSTSQTVLSAPASYTNLLQTSSAPDTTGAQCITARRSLEAASEDPGVFTLSLTGVARVFTTIAIAPAYVGMKYEHLNITNGTTLWAGMYTSQPIAVPDTGITRAVIVCHGQSLNAAEYSNVVRKNLSSYLGKVIVIAPYFPESANDAESGQLFWGSSWPELGRSSASLAWRISSGGVLDEIISRLYTTFTNLEGVIIAGHSAGGQLVNRYSAASSDTRNRYLVSAASSYLYPGVERSNGAGGWSVPSSPSTYNDYKFGLSNLGSISYVNDIGAETLRSRLFSAQVTYMVGANDNNPADSSMDLTADAAVQGDTRVSRQQLYADYLAYHYSFE